MITIWINGVEVTMPSSAACFGLSSLRWKHDCLGIAYAECKAADSVTIDAMIGA